MPTKAVFFDWFNTLARFEPAREELHRQAYRELGIVLSLREAARGLLAADRLWFAENARARIESRPAAEQLELGIRYEAILLGEAGLTASREVMGQAFQRVRQQSPRLSFVLFADVLPNLKQLSETGFKLGLLTNVTREMNTVITGLGLSPYLDFVITSQEAGADKPHPPIFLAALKRAGVSPREAVHVGDQPQMDVAGARGVGITPILIDRFDLYPEVADCPRIANLDGLRALLI